VKILSFKRVLALLLIVASSWILGFTSVSISFRSQILLLLLPIFFCVSASGALIVDKPAGLTSHDVVARVRRLAGTRRVGHAGTLDPFATGVLVVCLNRATRLVQFLVGLDKQYLATVRLGFETDSQDLSGKQITPLISSNLVSPEAIRQVLGQFVGRQLQIPPMFSAKRVAGERLHRAARAGREVERSPVSIEVYSIELVRHEDGEIVKIREDSTVDFNLQINCSSGTYVRTLGRDIGQRLGVGAHLAGLRRVGVGPFRLSDASTLSELEGERDSGLEAALIKPVDMLSHFPAVKLGGELLERVIHGRPFEVADERASEWRSERGLVRLCDDDGELVGVGRCESGSNLIKPCVVLRD
jgi:tRNA pseudouridine55 synthase